MKNLVKNFLWLKAAVHGLCIWDMRLNKIKIYCFPIGPTKKHKSLIPLIGLHQKTSIIKEHYIRKYVNYITFFRSYIRPIWSHVFNLVSSKFLNAYKLKKENYERK